MSNPSETGGHPLASPLPQPQDTTPSSTAPRRRRRTSQSSSQDHAGGAKSTLSRRRLGTRRDTAFLPHTGSSRGDPSAMQRSNSRTMPTDVHYTRTGRISKAKKGLKVHDCECGRSYTRAEHLRRHQKNHATEDALHCDFPECGKVFYRLDLLQRHRERHNEGGPESPQPSVHSPGRASEPETQVSPAGGPLAPIITAQPSHYYPPATSPMLETAANASHLKPRPSLSSRQNAVMGPVPVDGLQTNIPWSEPFTHSPNNSHYSSSGYASPIPPTSEYIFPNHPPYGSSSRTRTSSNASFIEQTWGYPSRSPTSATSTMPPYQWTAPDRSPASTMAFPPNSFPMSLPMVTGIDALPGYGPYSQKTMAQRDEEEQQILFPITEQSYGMGQTAHSYPFEQCLNNYWRHFHSIFPVVHRATFTSINQPPMLRAAMIAIGGQYSNDAAVKRKSRILHERCVKLLVTREHELIMEPDRNADWQALFLVEVLSQYRALRAPKSLSARFEAMYHKFADNFPMTTSNMVDNVAAALVQPENATYERWGRWIDLCTQQRLLVCCYILEHQQATLLARQPQPSLVQLSGFDLPLPAHSSLWDANDPSEWALAAQQFAHLPQYVYQIGPDMGSSVLDAFQSSLLIAAHYNYFNNNASPYMNPPNFAPIDHLLDSSPMTKHQLLTAKLLQVTPIRALLAVSGESWILSEKVTSAQAFSTHKTTLRSWTNGLWADTAEPQHQAVNTALHLAIEILQHAITEKPSALRLEVGAFMGLYFAALVLWSVTVVANSRINVPQTSVQQYRFHSHSPLPAARNFSVTSAPPQTPVSSPLHAFPPTSTFNSSLTSHPYSPTSEGMPHAEAERLSTIFLDMVFLETGSLGTCQRWPSDATQWLQGCGALMCWVRTRLRGYPEARDSVILSNFSAGPTSAGTGRGCDGCGELLDGVLSNLEKIMGRGWEGWGV